LRFCGLLDGYAQGIAIKKPTEAKSGIFCILEHKRMSDVSDQYQYTVRYRQVEEDQNASFRTALSKTLQHQAWVVKQVSFITGARSTMNCESTEGNV
jgi:hypothetical protein